MDKRDFSLKNISELLTRPGNGVFTVNTAKEKKESLILSYYGTKDEQKSHDKWLKDLNHLNRNIIIQISLINLLEKYSIYTKLSGQDNKRVQTLPRCQRNSKHIDKEISILFIETKWRFNF
jgi:hypothetical protein